MRKLSRTKRADPNQQKISNFFCLSKNDQTCASNEQKMKKSPSDKNTLVNNMESSSKCNRVLGNHLCPNCCKNINNGPCNNCNHSLSITKEEFPISNDIIKTFLPCEDTKYVSTEVSEDVIPPTPTPTKKRKRIECTKNSLKRSLNNKRSEDSLSAKTKKLIVYKEDHTSQGNESVITKVVHKKKENDEFSRGIPKVFANPPEQFLTPNQATKSTIIEDGSNRREKELGNNIKPCNEVYVENNDFITNHIQMKRENESKVLDEENPYISFEDIDGLLDDWNIHENTSYQKAKLDNGVRCEVVSVRSLDDSREIMLTLKPLSGSNTVALCILRGSWAGTSVNSGDIVSVSALAVPNQADLWVVDDTAGQLTVDPDILVSGTTVVGSLFCMRRSVLSDSYRGLDSDSSIMVIGSFLHQLLQEVLKKKVSSIQEIKDVFNDMVSSRHFIYNLYASGMTLEKTKETISEFIPKIHAFVEKYIGTRKPGDGIGSMWNNKDSWDGKISDVADIEENIWAPKLGLKGKVDVTVHTVSRNKKKVMPLELKTGRASFSSEHRGQVILYGMMMTELGRTVDSGLLLYLREGVMKEVSVGAAERRDLSMLRNQLVDGLKKSRRVVIEGSRVTAPQLPPPINHHSACSKCPYLTLCSAALRGGDRSSLSEDNPLQGLSVASTVHLSVQHIEYVFHWSGILRTEHDGALLNSTPLHTVWTVPPAQRQEVGSCLASLPLVGEVTEVSGGSYEHTFDAGRPRPWPAEGEYVIVSCDERPAVAAGIVRQVVNNWITINLERNLSAHYGKDRRWHLDKYESQSALVFNFTNLGCLLDNTEQASRLRLAVVDLKLPTFQPKLSRKVLKASEGLVDGLNDQQQKAVFKAIAADHYMLIKGMPGTGKTATMAALVQLAVRLGRSVLVTSHTHAAVDNVLLRLAGHGLPMLRLGPAHRLHPRLAAYGDRPERFATPDELRAFYDSKMVVGVTCLGAAHPLLTRRHFDLCLVDEATQVLQPTVLRPLFAADRFVLVGDPHQLPPLVRSAQAKKLGLGESLFARLDRPAVTAELSLQYRMNERITELANILTYAGRLRCANSDVAQATLKLPLGLVDVPVWLSQALSCSLERSVAVLDTGAREEPTNCENQFEADIVTHILVALNKSGASGERTGVIAPYRDQVELLRKRAGVVDQEVEVNTVDQYQGRDKDVVIYSCTRSSSINESDILSDKNRLTVAITRSRYKLVIVGNVALLRGYPLFDTLFRSLPNDCIIPVS